MYISKWWGNYIGASDDTLLLLDYFATKETLHFEFKNIVTDIHLDSLLANNSFKSCDLYFEINENFIPHFDTSTNVLTDLAAIILECLKNKAVSIRDLDPSSRHNKTFTISATNADVKILKESLDYFINNANAFEIVNFMPEADFSDFLNSCTEISHELVNYC